MTWCAEYSEAPTEVEIILSKKDIKEIKRLSKYAQKNKVDILYQLYDSNWQGNFKSDWSYLKIMEYGNFFFVIHNKYDVSDFAEYEIENHYIS